MRRVIKKSLNLKKNQSGNLKSKVKIVHLEKGEILFSEGDSSESMYIIQSGSVAVKKLKSKKAIILSILKTNQIIGEMGFFKNEPRTATAEALSPSKLIEFPYSALRDEFKALPQWVKILIQTVLLRLKEANEKISSLNQESIKNEEQENSFFKISILQILELLQLLFKSQQLIETEKNQILTLSFKTLKEMGLIYRFTPYQLKKILKSLKESDLIKISHLKNKNYEISVCNLEHLRNFTQWFKDQCFIQPKNRIFLDEKEVHLLERVLAFAEEKNKDFRDFQSMSIKNFFCTEKDFKKIIFLSEKGFLKISSETEDKEKKTISFEIFPLRLEKMFFFWKTFYNLKKNETTEEKIFSFP